MDSLRGQLIVAGPALEDPNFRRSVVLVAEHNEQGAMGVVLNRPSDTPVHEAAPNLAGLVDHDELVFVGGPVQPGAVVVLADFRNPARAARLVLGDIGFVSSGDDFSAVGTELRRARVFAGYAGWDAGQLESEIERDDWIVERPPPEDVLTADPEELWARTLERKGGRFALLARMPEDPSLN